MSSALHNRPACPNQRWGGAWSNGCPLCAGYVKPPSTLVWVELYGTEVKCAPAPVQAVLLVNIIYFAWLCHLTLPLYSLVVHMGTDIKHEALPPELRERLAQTRARHQQVPLLRVLHLVYNLPLGLGPLKTAACWLVRLHPALHALIYNAGSSALGHGLQTCLLVACARVQCLCTG